MLKTRKWKFGALLAGAIAILAAVPTIAVATGASALKWEKGANEAWKASSPKTTFVSSVITITCTTNTAGGSSVGSGPDIGALKMNPPKFSNCKDNLGGHDTVTTASAGWKVAFYWDKSNSHCPSGTGGGKSLHCVVITVPKDAATIVVGGLSECKITVQPSAGTFVGATAKAPGGKTKDTFAVNKAPLKYSGCGVTSGSATFTGTYTLSAPNGGVLVATSS